MYVQEIFMRFILNYYAPNSLNATRENSVMTTPHPQVIVLYLEKYFHDYLGSSSERLLIMNCLLSPMEHTVVLYVHLASLVLLPCTTPTKESGLTARHSSLMGRSHPEGE